MAYKRTRASSPPDSHKRSRGGGQESYVSLGTALPQDDDKGAFVPVWKQTVTDERGRRRLHGAFTGGFSAGYFNTVGSKEGWTPKTFLSSRTDRNKDQTHGQTQRVEDFMDVEDLAAAAESRQLETAQNFAGIGQVGDTPEQGFFGLFLTQEDTMGVKIAQKMGWRRDQGIGCKISRNARVGEDGDSANSSAHMFAPEDARVMSISKEDVRRKGLGYRSENRLATMGMQEHEDSPVLDLHFLEPSKKMAKLKKNPYQRSLFGVAVSNDTGSDDEDPYDLGPKITFNKTIGKDKKTKKPSKFAKAGTGEKHVFVPKKEVSKALVPLDRLSDHGKAPLKGFRFATNITIITSRPKYSPPTVPTDWKSSKSSVVPLDKTPFQSTADAAKVSILDAKARSVLLGEKALPGKSIFDFISQEARDRLANLSGKSDLPQGLGERAPDGHLPATNAQPKDLWSLVPSLDKSIAVAALAKGATGWMPYAEDLEKRARYVGFLELHAGLKDDLPERTRSISVSDWTKELQEFAHAAQVFKPSTGIMASRFTSSTASSTNTSGYADADTTLLRKPVAKREDPAENAAKLGMYGPMTRSSFSFYPSRLLCKRFNVKPPPDIPHDNDARDGRFGATTEEAVSKLAMDKMMHEVLTRGARMERPAWMAAAVPVQRQGENIDTSVVDEHAKTTERAVVDVERNDALSKERAAEDVFVAIFGDDDDDDEDDE